MHIESRRGPTCSNLTDFVKMGNIDFIKYYLKYCGNIT